MKSISMTSMNRAKGSESPDENRGAVKEKLAPARAKKAGALCQGSEFPTFIQILGPDKNDDPSKGPQYDHPEVVVHLRHFSEVRNTEPTTSGKMAW